MPPSRIDELRRRVQSDPASIAFAQLAEEYRRSGQTEEAVRVCREGLIRHPAYLSARVTLGRALLDLGQLIGARAELEFVAAEAPENLAAVRGLAEICHREGHTAEALTYYQRALTLARHDPEIEEVVQQLSRQLGAAAASPPSGLSFEEAHQELLSAGDRMPLAAPPAASADRNADHGSTAPFDFDRLVAALGSPAAPSQTEAAVEGRPSTAPIELPEPASTGPDPFAALEAELRATGLSQSAPSAERVAPWSPPDTDTPDDTEVPDPGLAPGPRGIESVLASQSAEEVLADTLLSDSPSELPADPVDGTFAPDAALSDPFSVSDDSSASDDSARAVGMPGAAAAVADELLAAPAAVMEAQEPDVVLERTLEQPPERADTHDAPASQNEVPEAEQAQADVPQADEARADSPDASAAPHDDTLGARVEVVETVQLSPSVVPDVVGDPAAADSTGVAEAERPAPAALAAPAAPAAPAPAAATEGVLDELEGWLNTLQDRSSQ